MKSHLVIDGNEELRFEFVGTPVFSTDSKRLVYAAKVGNKWCLVVDGKEGKMYDSFVTSVGKNCIQLTQHSPLPCV